MKSRNKKKTKPQKVPELNDRSKFSINLSMRQKTNDLWSTAHLRPGGLVCFFFLVRSLLVTVQSNYDDDGGDGQNVVCSSVLYFFQMFFCFYLFFFVICFLSCWRVMIINWTFVMVCPFIMNQKFKPKKKKNIETSAHVNGYGGRMNGQAFPGFFGRSQISFMWKEICALKMLANVCVYVCVKPCENVQEMFKTVCWIWFMPVTYHGLSIFQEKEIKIKVKNESDRKKQPLDIGKFLALKPTDTDTH